MAAAAQRVLPAVPALAIAAERVRVPVPDAECARELHDAVSGTPTLSGYHMLSAQRLM
jgi:hypothetical protein